MRATETNFIGGTFTNFLSNVNEFVFTNLVFRTFYWLNVSLGSYLKRLLNLGIAAQTQKWTWKLILWDLPLAQGQKGTFYSLGEKIQEVKEPFFTC